MVRFFAVLLENPLLLQPGLCFGVVGRIVALALAALSAPDSALQVRAHAPMHSFSHAVLCVPECAQRLLEGYRSEFFARVVGVTVGYLTLVMDSPHLGLDPVPAVCLLDRLARINRGLDQLVPLCLWYCEAIHRRVDAVADIVTYRTAPAQFAWCRYGCVLPLQVCARRPMGCPGCGYTRVCARVAGQAVPPATGRGAADAGGAAAGHPARVAGAACESAGGGAGRRGGTGGSRAR